MKRYFYSTLALVLLVVQRSVEQRCGTRNVEFLVRNGYPSSARYWPWHVSLFRRVRQEDTGRHFRGGTILDKNTILTAANCMKLLGTSRHHDQFVVHAGQNQLNERIERPYTAKEVIVHPEYNGLSLDHDIALIKLATDVVYTDNIQPVCLWNMGKSIKTVIGTAGTVVGFGRTESGRQADTLIEAQLPVVENGECIRSKPALYGTQLTSRMFCAGTLNGTTHVCRGDNGGGIFFDNFGTWYIRGIISFTKSSAPAAHGACESNAYAVFTDVAQYLDWIETHRRETAQSNPATTVQNHEWKQQMMDLETCGKGAYPFRYESPKPEFLEFPWVGLIDYYVNGSALEKKICHAVLISARYLITAAHCVDKHGLDLTVRLGEYDKSTPTDCAPIDGITVCSPPLQIRSVESVTLHHSFNKPRFAHDIALIRLRERADITQSNVQPICLPLPGQRQNLQSVPLIRAAWADGATSSTITRSSVEILDARECQNKYKKVPIELEMAVQPICTKQPARSATGCTLPASAAPLQAVVDLNGFPHYVVHGLLSLGSSDCRMTLPDVYTNVGSYLDWIRGNMFE